MYIAKLKDGLKRVKKIFSMILERVLEMVWWRGRKWDHIEKDFWSWNVSPLKMLTSPLFEETFAASLFFFLRLLSTWGIWWYLRRKSLLQKNFFSNGFNILAVNAYHGMELCTLTWLNHDFGDGGLWIYWRWTHIPEWNYARQYLWVRLAINVGGKSFSKKIQNSSGHIP
jgi:hypothetical protein